MSVREVLWIARLHEIVDNSVLLEEWASAYALRDQICWVLEWPNDTLDLDLLLIKRKQKDYPSHLDERSLDIVTMRRQLQDRPPPLLAHLPKPPFFGDEGKSIQKALNAKGYILEGPYEQMEV